jgi:hypothetical protein
MCRQLISVIVRICLTCSFCVVTSASDRNRVSFERDVMAVLSKAGCNLGTCHGNLNGKGGFFLSLRGQDSQHDYSSITQDLGGRRVNRIDPSESLILLKPTAQIAHQGGKRFDLDSWEYRILRNWIEQGAKPPDEAAAYVTRIEVQPQSLIVTTDDQVELSATAFFSDGSQSDVSAVATYEVADFVATVSAEGVVRRQSTGETTVIVRYLSAQAAVRIAFIPSNDSFTWSEPQAYNYVDRIIFQKLRSLRLNPVSLAGDNVFVRRAYIDVIGIPPTAEEARTFVDDPSADKRLELIDDLLSRPEFADHWALKWSDLLRVEEKLLDAVGTETFHRWIRRCMADGVPVNEFVGQMVTAEGSTYKNPPANLYRALRDPLVRGETMARLFLGLRLECARCHNHPFDQWTQDDYYSWAACFAQIDYQIIENKSKDKFDKSNFIGEQIVKRKPDAEVINPRTQQVAAPRVLDGSRQPLADADRLSALADWLANDNRQLAATLVNRIWYQLMGRGLVEPVDDFRVTNPPSHPELLDALVDEFITSNYDLRTIVRRIMQSRSYQLAFSADVTDDLSLNNYAATRVRRLTAEQLLDAQSQFLGIAPTFNGYDPGIRAGQISGVRRVRRRDQPLSAGDRFLTIFGKPERLMSCECERSDEPTLNQVFFLIGDESLQQRIESETGRIGRLAANATFEEAMNQLYWSALARAPSEMEMQQAREMAATTGDMRMILQDVGWALLNSKEFLFRY